MTKKLFAALLLSLAVTACDSGSTETNSNVNNAPRSNTNGQVSPTPASSPSPEPSPSVKSELKVGDKVKVAINGSVSEATVVSVDEKAGKVTVKFQGQSGEKTVAIGDLRP